jgi:beta-1,4-N-acetylglucosaminyltransferase
MDQLNEMNGVQVIFARLVTQINGILLLSLFWTRRDDRSVTTLPPYHGRLHCATVLLLLFHSRFFAAFISTSERHHPVTSNHPAYSQLSMSRANAGRKVFVTVGTTLFEGLVDAVTTEAAIQWMLSKGYTHLVIQYGRGRMPSIGSDDGVPHAGSMLVTCYDYKPSLEPDMKDADLIISHAGAGTVMECVRLKRRMVVVINTILMDNHQTELADAMGERGQVYVVRDPQALLDLGTWDEFESFQPLLNEPGDQDIFPLVLRQFFGLDKER